MKRKHCPSNDSCRQRKCPVKRSGAEEEQEGDQPAECREGEAYNVEGDSEANEAEVDSEVDSIPADAEVVASGVPLAGVEGLVRGDGDDLRNPSIQNQGWMVIRLGRPEILPHHCIQGR